MSVKLMSAIFETEFRDLPDGEGNTTKASTAKLVLLALADHANDEGEGAYPGLVKMMLKTGLTKQGIMKTYDTLLYNGIIYLVGKSKLDTNNYTINTLAFPSGKQGLLVNSIEILGKPDSVFEVNPVVHNQNLTINETSIEKSTKSTSKRTSKEKNKDVFDYLSQSAEHTAQVEAEKAVLLTLEGLLKRNFDLTEEWHKFAAWLITESAKGRDYKTWAKWYMQEPFRAQWTWKQTDATFRASYPQAFSTSGTQSRRSMVITNG